jgi:nitroreductase
MDMFELIKSRRSIRKFTEESVSDEIIDRIIEAGTWAPSGLNNQPWKFAAVRDEALKTNIATLTRYSRIVLNANTLIAVFLDNSLSYDRTKDCQAIGACIQNMLLTVHSIGLGAVWLGEILKNKDKVLELLGGAQNLELMALLALGYPAEKKGKGLRNDFNQTIFFSK